MATPACIPTSSVRGFPHSQTMERAQMSIGCRMDKEGVVLHDEILLSQQKNEVLPFATMWLELECNKLSETSQRKTNTI